jgi:uncharacterized coiled-coil DUF342 family protein
MDINMIKKVVSETTGIDLNDKELNSRRISENVEARTMYFSLAREFTTLSLADIGKSIRPRKDHATVLYSIRKAKDSIRFDKAFRQKLDNLRSRVEFLRTQVQESEIDFITALDRLDKMEEKNMMLIGQNADLLKQIQNLNDKIERQNKYLIENGYVIGRSVFKED